MTRREEKRRKIILSFIKTTKSKDLFTSFPIFFLACSLVKDGSAIIALSPSSFDMDCAFPEGLLVLLSSCTSIGNGLYRGSKLRRGRCVGGARSGV